MHEDNGPSFAALGCALILTIMAYYAALIVFIAVVTFIVLKIVGIVK